MTQDRATGEKVVGYRRVSSAGQNLARQELPEVTGRIFEETMTGARRDRPALQEMIAYIREGDEVHVHSIDRLARSLRDLQGIVDDIIGKGASIRFLKEGLHFMPNVKADPFQKLMFQMLGSFAEFEKSLIEARRDEGIAKAKAEGKYKGRKATIPSDVVEQLLARNMKADDIAKWMGIGRASVFRIKSKMKPIKSDDLGFRIIKLRQAIQQCDDVEEVKALESELNECKKLNNQVWSILYEHTDTTQPEALVYLKRQGWSVKQIAERKKLDEGYVEYVVAKIDRDGMYEVD